MMLFWSFIFSETYIYIYIIDHVYTYNAIWGKKCRTTFLWVLYFEEVGDPTNPNQNPPVYMIFKKSCQKYRVSAAEIPFSFLSIRFYFC